MFGIVPTPAAYHEFRWASPLGPAERAQTALSRRIICTGLREPRPWMRKQRSPGDVGDQLLGASRSFSILVEHLCHLKVILQRRKRMSSPVLQLRVISALRI